jgi:Ca-activated chloride channel family protein
MEPTLSLQAIPLHKTFASSPGKELVLIRIKAPTELVGERPSLSAILALDTSGSMQGTPLQQVIRSAIRLSEILSDKDSLGVVAFDSSARQVSPLRRLNASSRAQLQQEVRSLVANGNTNISQGISTSALMFPNSEPLDRNIILVMSDGQPNVGSTTKEMLSQEASFIKGKNISISSLGFGRGHNEDILSGLAQAGGGRYNFIDDPAAAENTFAKALGAQRDIAAQNVRLAIQPSEGVEIVKIWGDPKTSFGGDGLRIPLQDLIAADELNIIVELQTSSLAESVNWSPLRAKVSWSAPGSKEEQSVKTEVFVAVSSSVSHPQLEVQAHIAITRAAELRDQAKALSDKRDFKGALAVFEKAKQLIEEVPEFSDHGALRDAWEVLIDDIEMMKKIPDEAIYQKYKRTQKDYNDFAVGGLNARSQAVMSPSARLFSNQAAGMFAPKIRVWLRKGNEAPSALEFQQTEISIGRTKDCEVCLASSNVSRRHAQILFHDGAYWVMDLGSSNGIFYNGVKIEKVKLAPGVVVAVGEFSLWIENV